MEIAQDAEIIVVEKRLSITDVYTADEMFTTGTMGELVPVYEVDGRMIGDGGAGPVTARLQNLYADRVAIEGELLPF